MNLVEFKDQKEWIVAGKTVKIGKIETSDYTLQRAAKSRFQELDQEKVLENVISNVAQLPNGVFLEKDRDNVLARINDVVDTTLIVTNWTIPVTLFNEKVLKLQIQKQLPEHIFHVISKIS